MKTGTKHSEETRQRMSESHKKRPIVGVSLTTGEVIRLPSTRAAREHGFASSNIVACCRGRKKSCYGFTWSYEKDDEDPSLPTGGRKAISVGDNVVVVAEYRKGMGGKVISADTRAVVVAIETANGDGRPMEVECTFKRSELRHAS